MKLPPDPTRPGQTPPAETDAARSADGGRGGASVEDGPRDHASSDRTAARLAAVTAALAAAAGAPSAVFAQEVAQCGAPSWAWGAIGTIVAAAGVTGAVSSVVRTRSLLGALASVVVGLTGAAVAGRQAGGCVPALEIDAAVAVTAVMLGCLLSIPVMLRLGRADDANDCEELLDALERYVDDYGL